MLGVYFHRKRECAENIDKMAQVIKVADPRVVVEQGVVLNDYEGPLQWEHYKIPASGLSNTQITFANLVTLGTNRIYNSQFTVEYELEVDYSGPSPLAAAAERFIHLKPFPLSQVSDQIRCNINGAACVSRPATTLLQRLPYWRQAVLDKTCSECPHELPPAGLPSTTYITGEMSFKIGDLGEVDPAGLVPVPIPDSIKGISDQVSIPITHFIDGSDDATAYDRKLGRRELNVMSVTNDTVNQKLTFTIREPVLCPPFNTRLDNLYQAPLCNITSLDIVYTLNDLKNMVTRRAQKWSKDISRSSATDGGIEGITHNLAPLVINIKSAQLCYDVASLPAGMTVPPSITMPYYDYVNYVTDIPTGHAHQASVHASSGVYTLSQVPTAIYIFVSENINFRNTYQTGQYLESYFPHFCPIKNINLTVGNNTKILDTTTMYDRYKMCVANGLENVPWRVFSNAAVNNGSRKVSSRHVLRLIPGIDFTIPEQRLVGGTPADQLVFQAHVETDCSDISDNNMSLWIMFEYCGVLTIEPVHARIDMIPLKSIPPRGQPQVVASVAATDIHGGGEGTNPRGAGIFDIVSAGVGLARRGLNWLGRKGVFSALNKRYNSDDMEDAPPPKVGAGLISGSQFYD